MRRLKGKGKLACDEVVGVGRCMSIVRIGEIEFHRIKMESAGFDGNGRIEVDIHSKVAKIHYISVRLRLSAQVVVRPES